MDKDSLINKIELIPELIGDEKLEFSEDGSMLLGISSNGTFNVYDIEKKTIIRNYGANYCFFDCTDFSPDGKFFASKKSNFSPVINVWYTESRKLFNTFEGHSGTIQSICFASNEAFISLSNIQMLRSIKVEVKIWDIIGRRCIRTFLETSLVNAKKVFSSPDGNYLVIIYPRKIQICSSSTGDFIAYIGGLDEHIDKVSFSSDGKKLAIITRQNRLKICNTFDGRRIKELQLEDPGEIKEIIFSHDSNSIMVITSPDNKFRVFDIKTGDKFFDIDLNEELHSKIMGFCISFGGRYLAAQFKNYTLIYEIIWEGESSKVFSDFENFLAYGNSFLKQGLVEKAYESFKKAISIKGYEENTLALEGLRICEKRIEISKMVLLGEHYFQERAYEKVENLYNELLEIKELDARTRFLLSDKIEDIKLIRNLNNFSEDFKLHNIKEIDDSFSAYGVYFRIYKENLGKLLNYIKYLSKVTDLPADMWNMIGYAYSANMQFYEALASFKKAYILEAEHKSYHRNYAWALYYDGQYVNSFSEFNKLYDKTGQDEEILIDMAVAMTGKDNNLNDSLEIFSQITRRNPSSIRANLYFGELLSGINDFFPTFFNPAPDKERALHYLNKAEELNPHLIRIKSSLDYAKNGIFAKLEDNSDDYSDRDFFSMLYGDSLRGKNWSILETYMGQHSGPIKHILFSKPGNIFLSLGEKSDKMICYIHQNRRWKHVSMGLEKIGISFIAISKRGEYIASSGKGEVINLWGYNDGEYKFLRGWRSLQNNINNLFFIQGGKQLVSCGKNQNLKFWDVESGICLKTYKDDTFHPSELDISSDERRFISVCSDKTIKLFDTDTGKCSGTFPKCSISITSIKFSPDNKYIVSGDTEGDVKLWDINNLTCINSISTQQGKIRKLYFSPDGEFLFIWGKELFIWNLSKNFKEDLEFCSKGVTCLAFSPDNNLVVTGDNRGVIKIWHKSIICELNYIYYLISDKVMVSNFHEAFKKKNIHFEPVQSSNDFKEQETIKIPQEKTDKYEPAGLRNAWKNVINLFNK